jgi:elongation factor Ts
MVKELRDATSAGMMDCKRALQETDGDFDGAVKLLRERGMAQAGKRASRETTEGKVGVRVRDGVGTIVAVGSETEPVSNNDEFLDYARRVLEAVEQDGPEAVDKLEQERMELVGKIGENVRVVGASRLEASDGEQLAEYVHPPANKIGVLVKTRGGSPELARDLAMHISFARPTYGKREEVPAELVEAERAILEKLPDVQSKPEDVRGKIVDGMLNKRFYGESVLVEQPWFREASTTVGKVLGEAGMELVDYAWYSVS